MSPREDGAPRRSSGKRAVPFVAAGVAAALTLGVVVTSGGGAAGAADIKAQSVGRFVDGTLGGMSLESVVDVHDARAKAPGTQSQQNPLDATLLGQLDVPLGNALKLPGGGAFTLGAANQVAVAKTSGYSYGASGAVSNSGGVALGGNDNSFPADATIDLSSDLLGSTTIPGLPAVPGLPAGANTSLATLGGVRAKIGAVSALAQTSTGGKVVTPKSSLAGLQLVIGSPALGGLLSQLKSLSSSTPLTGIIGLLGASPLKTCALTSTSVDNISLDDGAVVIDVTNATITVDVALLLQQLLHKDITKLTTSNFDLTDFLVTNLPAILSTGLTNVVTGIVGTSATTGLRGQFTNCAGVLGTTLNALVSPGETALLDALQGTDGKGGLFGQFTSASSGPLGQLASGLNMVADIGLNVQSGPGIAPHDKTYPFKTNLEATPDQATPVVDNQTIVRAIEVQLLNAAGTAGAGLPGGIGTLPGLGSLPGTNSLSATKLTKGGVAQAAPHAVAAVNSLATLALGNAAVGPSTSTAATTAPPATTTPATGTAIPTGVPAGQASHDNSSTPPALLAVLALLAVMLAGGGTFAYRRRIGIKH